MTVNFKNHFQINKVIQIFLRNPFQPKVNWKQKYLTSLTYCLLLFCLTVFIPLYIEDILNPIPNLNNMDINKGVIVDLKKQTTHSIGKFTIKKSDGKLINYIESVGNLYVGQTVVIWSQSVTVLKTTTKIIPWQIVNSDGAVIRKFNYQESKERHLFLQNISLFFIVFSLILLIRIFLKYRKEMI